MIQRIQSVYTIIAIITLIIGPYFLDNFVKFPFAWTSFSKPLIYISFCSSIVLVISLFSFKRRKLQFVLNRICIIFQFSYIGYLLFSFYSQKNLVEIIYGISVPIMIIFLIVLANRAIRKDEELIRSMDRVR